MNIRGKSVVDEIASRLASRLLGSPFEVELNRFAVEKS